MKSISSSRVVVIDKVIEQEQNLDEIEVVGDITKIKAHKPKLQKTDIAQTKKRKDNVGFSKKVAPKQVPTQGNNFLLNGAQHIDDQGFEVVPEKNKSKRGFLKNFDEHNTVTIFEVLSIKKKCRRFRLSRKVEESKSKKYHHRGLRRRKQEIYSC